MKQTYNKVLKALTPTPPEAPSVPEAKGASPLPLTEAYVEDPEALQWFKTGYLPKFWRECDWAVTFCNFLIGGYDKKKNGWKYFQKRVDEIQRKRIKLVAKAKKQIEKEAKQKLKKGKG